MSYAKLRNWRKEDDWLKDEIVELDVVEVVDDVEGVKDIVVEDVLVKEDIDLCSANDKQDVGLDVELNVQNVVDVGREDVVVESGCHAENVVDANMGDVLEVDIVEQDVLEVRDVEYDVFVEAEDFANDLEVVEAVEFEFDEIYVVQCEVVVVEPVGDDVHDADVQDERPGAG